MRLVTDDLAQSERWALVRRLLSEWAVLVENFKVGDMARYGLGGPMNAAGEGDDRVGQRAAEVGVAAADLFTGQCAIAAILPTLRQRNAIGRGQRIDMASLDTQVSMLTDLLCTPSKQQ
jgi:crotonobetainyl-CoA:carnitine CoA-transferase CaiB-like acyl-CoA transferase